MVSPARTRPGKAHLRRDSQKWVFDWVIKETGNPLHFQADGRGRLPRSVKNHDMISKHLGLQARRLERIAQAEAAAGHRETAMETYYRAALEYLDAQHPVLETNDEKRYLHGSLMRCYDKVRELAPYRIEHIDIPWNGTVVSGNLHLAPVDGPAPLVFYVPGCDQTKEAWPHPYYNQALQRGLHAFSFDGPGQGESNLRGIKLASNNYEDAACAALDYLLQRPEIDADRVGVYALSFGSFWGLRIASRERRIKGVAAPSASYCDKYYLMNQESPRYKQLFAYLTQSSSEAELDAILEEMTMDGYMEQITAPVLLAAGEFDPRSPLDEIYRLYDQIAAPKELWVFSDQHHNPSIAGGGHTHVWQQDIHGAMCDWLRERFEGKALRHPGQVVYVDNSSAGPNDASATLKRRWYE
ncbi:MAG: alpha/beta hydrolase [Chloroflexi bacterium]|nr:alpha/beta hydrolase [Chloroflexota bacterium]